MLKTKIVCTLGPTSDDEATIRAFIQAGMAVARINFSHGSHEDHARRIGLVRRTAAEMGRIVAVLADLQGPKLRVGVLPPEGVMLAEGQTVTLTGQESPADPAAIPLPHPEVIRDVRPGDRILLDDGLLELKVVDRDAVSLRAEVVTGGVLLSRKGLSLPHTGLKMPSITDKDRADAAFALGQEVDYIALSFVRCADDVRHLRAFLQAQGADTPIIAKIEKPEALDCVEAILDASDGLMVARGDLGVETPAEAGADGPEADHPHLQRGGQAGDHRHADARLDDPQPAPHPGRGVGRGQCHPRRHGCDHAVRRDGDGPLPAWRRCRRWPASRP